MSSLNVEPELGLDSDHVPSSEIPSADHGFVSVASPDASPEAHPADSRQNNVSDPKLVAPVVRVSRSVQDSVSIADAADVGFVVLGPAVVASLDVELMPDEVHPADSLQDAVSDPKLVTPVVRVSRSVHDSVPSDTAKVNNCVEVTNCPVVLRPAAVISLDVELVSAPDEKSASVLDEDDSNRTVGIAFPVASPDELANTLHDTVPTAELVSPVVSGTAKESVPVADDDDAVTLDAVFRPAVVSSLNIEPVPDHVPSSEVPNADDVPVSVPFSDVPPDEVGLLVADSLHDTVPDPVAAVVSSSVHSVHDSVPSADAADVST